MLRTLRLTAAVLAGFALPALAQTTSTTPARPGTPPPAAVTGQTPGSPPATGAAGSTGRTGSNAATTTVAPSSPATTAGRPTTPPPAATTAAPSAPARPSTAATAPAAGVAATGKKIDINSASEQEIATLPGIGPAIAKNIVQGRPWDDLNDLVKKKAVPQGVFDRDKERMALANINTSSAADMAKTLPGIGEVRSRAIVNGRPYASPQDLVTKKVLTEGQFDKIKDLVAY